MKVSDAIEQLIEFMDNFGDVEVVFSAEEGGPVHAPKPEQKNAHIDPETVAWINGIHSRN